MTIAKLHNLNLPRLLIYLYLIAFSVPSAIANEVKLQSFEADYALYIAGLHAAKSTLTLSQSDNLWRWQTRARPRGIYRIFSAKKPYSETTFLLAADHYQIQSILLSDEVDKSLYETAQFDWQSGQASVLRKKITRSVAISGDVFDYHSINWLAAKMMLTGQTATVVDFYRKGELVKSAVTRAEDEDLEIGGRLISAIVYQQSIANKQSELRYFYDPARPLVPVKIEKIEPGKKTSVLILQNVVWR